MQGRLSPPVGGRIQAFPGAAWRDELARAAEAGLDCIEWVYEADAADPLATDPGVEQILGAVRETGVAVSSVCADYFMVERLVERPEAAEHLRSLAERAAAVGARHLVLPFVDESSLRAPADLDALVGVLHAVAPSSPVELHLETDLEPWPFAALLERISLPNVRANYDMGNSAALGREPGEELPALGSWLGSVHVKDRVRGGGTVPLGAGDVDFPATFRLLDEIGFAGQYILQVARGEAGDEVAHAIGNRLFVESQLAAVA